MSDLFKERLYKQSAGNPEWFSDVFPAMAEALIVKVRPDKNDGFPAH
jgi:hypothetical protein